MKDEIISFKTAKLAKENGFPQIKDFKISEKLSISFYGYTGRSKFPEWEIGLEEYHTDSLSAPTQSLLQRWLREEHDIDVCIYRDHKINYPLCYSVSVGKDKSINNLLLDDDYVTYEKALEQGLQEALKLI